MSKHTPGPYSATSFDVYAGDRCIANMDPGGVRKGGMLPFAANATRIAKCLNACAPLGDDPAAVLDEVRAFLTDMKAGRTDYANRRASELLRLLTPNQD